jgi:hypothetical protein
MELLSTSILILLLLLLLLLLIIIIIIPLPSPRLRMRDRRDVYMVYVSKCEGKSALGRRTRKWEDNIKMCLQEIGWGKNWIDLALDMEDFWALVNTVVTLMFP